MKRSAIVLAAASLVSLSTVTVEAEEFTYPTGAPEVSITFPDDWKVEPEGNVLHAYPQDESVYYGFLGVADGTPSDKVGEAVGEAVDAMVSDFKAGKDTQLEINGIKMYASDATAKTKDDGTPVNVSLAWFSPKNNGKNVVGLIYFGTEEAEKNHEAELESIIKSVKPIE